MRVYTHLNYTYLKAIITEYDVRHNFYIECMRIHVSILIELYLNKLYV